MGQIADDIHRGFQCTGCGICFEKEHGFPVLCNDCKKYDTNSQLPQATIKEL